MLFTSLIVFKSKDIVQKVNSWKLETLIPTTSHGTNKVRGFTKQTTIEKNIFDKINCHILFNPGIWRTNAYVSGYCSHQFNDASNIFVNRLVVSHILFTIYNRAQSLSWRKQMPKAMTEHARMINCQGNYLNKDRRSYFRNRTVCKIIRSGKCICGAIVFKLNMKRCLIAYTFTDNSLKESFCAFIH